MDTNKILSADLLDLVFDNRNKDYGAYELRKNYQVRITRALVFTGMFVLIAFTGVVLANKLKPKEKSSFVIHELTLEDIKPAEKLPEPIPEPSRQREPPQIRTEIYSPQELLKMMKPINHCQHRKILIARELVLKKKMGWLMEKP